MVRNEHYEYRNGVYRVYDQLVPYDKNGQLTAAKKLEKHTADLVSRKNCALTKSCTTRFQHLGVLLLARILQVLRSPPALATVLDQRAARAPKNYCSRWTAAILSSRPCGRGFTISLATNAKSSLIESEPCRALGGLGESFLSRVEMT